MNDLQFKAQIQKKLYREQTQLTHLQDLLARHDTTTHQMKEILSKFEGRLAKLESTITPVYTETATLQRRQENVEKTLEVLDHVISYYDVAKETQSMIREGPHGQLSNYLQSLERIKSARVYFDKNCPDCVEQVNLQELFEVGCDALQNEFRTLLSRHSKPIPANVVLEALDQINGELDKKKGEELEGVIDVETVLGNQWHDHVKYPQKINSDLEAISKWLIVNNSLDFVTAYESIRLSTLTKSLDNLRAHLKSNTVVNPTNLRFGMRQDLTPKKRMTLKPAKEKAGGIKPKPSNGEGDGERNDLDAETYIQTLTALLLFIHNERDLMAPIVPTKHAKNIFDRLATKTLSSVVAEGKSIAERASKSIANHDHSPVLSLFPILRHLKCLRADFDKVLEGCKGSTLQQLPHLGLQLNNCGAKALDEFNMGMRRDPDKHLPEDGTVHQLTSNVLGFMNQMLDYQQITGKMLASQEPPHASFGTPEKTQNVKCLSNYFIKLLGTLNLFLKTKSEHYDDPAKRAIFLLNNYNYIITSLQSSGILKLVSSTDNRMEITYQQLVNDQRIQYLQCWDKVLQNCKDSPAAFGLGTGMGQKVKDKDRQVIKDKFASFNKELDELSSIQKFFAVPDSNLRDKLRNEIVKIVVPQYTTFHSKYLKISFSKNPEKYIKYSPEEVKGKLQKFFDPSSMA